ncbi:DUF4247 domain-containing protein [Streptomyces sp. TRM43335]|uniref:DUF4247 domain-containing protein n=1 Tax=Streptomyces taklimakanensis TaxID=2569853 RepID=A0A6G2B695_9ACTN|nr:DUF4247 domain-containing protein [Streptomyces taklimakanensis]MTE17781.1 DUF4247 domain-containing protein [Streptomyces taklimakanensis]
MKTVRRVSAMFLAAMTLAGCSTDPEDGNDVPSGWIRRQYAAGGTGYVDRSDPPPRVAGEIDDHTSARDRHTADDMVFLRYRNDIVAISPRLGGSLIQIEDYRTGHRRWKSRIGSVWPDPDSAAFRGGGPGSGK